MIELKVGRTHRAKRPRRIYSYPTSLVNDRTIRWIGTYELQYDGPSIANGMRYPRMPIELFRQWADRDVTEELPPGEYAQWPPTKTP